MTIINLYRYERDDGGATVSPVKPEDKEYTIEYRLIADEGMILVKDDIKTPCIDVVDPEGWTEEIDPGPEPEPEE